jgi:hypothetical protein
MMNSYIGPDELIYNNDANGNIYSGGFNVNSIMMKAGFSPIMTLNETNVSQIGGAENVSDLFNNLVIPNWSLSYNYKNLGGSNSRKDFEDEEIITEELHEKLLNLVKATEDELKENPKKNKPNKSYKLTKKTNQRVKTNKKITKKQKPINV